MNVTTAAALSVAGVLLTGTAAAAVNANVLNVASAVPVGNASAVVPSQLAHESAEPTPTRTVVVLTTRTAAPTERPSTSSVGSDHAATHDPASSAAATPVPSASTHRHHGRHHTGDPGRHTSGHPSTGPTPTPTHSSDDGSHDGGSPTGHAPGDDSTGSGGHGSDDTQPDD